MPVAVFLWECDIGSSYFADKARQFAEEGLRSLSLPVRIPGSGAGHPQATPVH